MLPPARITCVVRVPITGMCGNISQLFPGALDQGGRRWTGESLRSSSPFDRHQRDAGPRRSVSMLARRATDGGQFSPRRQHQRLN